MCDAACRLGISLFLAHFSMPFSSICAARLSLARSSGKILYDGSRVMLFLCIKCDAAA
jgi:hypothetical protein